MAVWPSTQFRAESKRSNREADALESADHLDQFRLDHEHCKRGRPAGEPATHTLSELAACRKGAVPVNVMQTQDTSHSPNIAARMPAARYAATYVPVDESIPFS